MENLPGSLVQPHGATRVCRITMVPKIATSPAQLGKRRWGSGVHPPTWSPSERGFTPHGDHRGWIPACGTHTSRKPWSRPCRGRHGKACPCQAIFGLAAAATRCLCANRVNDLPLQLYVPPLFARVSEVIKTLFGPVQPGAAFGDIGPPAGGFGNQGVRRLGGGIVPGGSGIALIGDRLNSAGRSVHREVPKVQGSSAESDGRAPLGARAGSCS